MKLFIVSIFLFGTYRAFAEQIDVTVCNGDVTNQYVNNIDLAIDPHPVPIKAEATIRLHFGIDILKDIPTGSSIKLSLKKGFLPIPCLTIPDLPIPVGSCEYDVQLLLNFLKDDPNFDCSEYLPGNGCDLPMLPGHYGGTPGGDDAIEIILPADFSIPDILKPFLSGKIKINLSIADGGHSEIVCADTEIELDA